MSAAAVDRYKDWRELKAVLGGPQPSDIHPNPGTLRLARGTPWYTFTQN